VFRFDALILHQASTAPLWQTGAIAFRQLEVFEFNTIAINFYKKLGYREIARLPDETFARGRMWADIRMLKELV
jgi:ribosomal protein S18 acetylase RimI-like enzyme